MKRKLVALLLALALFAAIPFTAAADAYIPPEPVEGFDMNYAYMENGNCKALTSGGALIEHSKVVAIVEVELVWRLVGQCASAQVINHALWLRHYLVTR